MTAQESLQRLKDGVMRYADAARNDGDISLARREDTAHNGQHPYAVVISCSDSRVVPEDIFMTGIGELFTIRVAGNVVAGSQMGSVEYAVEHLGCPLVVVLGHSDCGAVGAAISGGGQGHVKLITDGIKLAIGSETDTYRAGCLNARRSAAIIRASLEAEGHEALVVAALYNIETGGVDWIQA